MWVSGIKLRQSVRLGSSTYFYPLSHLTGPKLVNLMRLDPPSQSSDRKLNWFSKWTIGFIWILSPHSPLCVSGNVLLSPVPQPTGWRLNRSHQKEIPWVPQNVMLTKLIGQCLACHRLSFSLLLTFKAMVLIIKTFSTCPGQIQTPLKLK